MSIFDLFAKIEREKKEPAGPPEFLVVGLGNPGKEYELTRHNVGFLALDRLAEKQGVRIDRAKWRGLYGECTLAGKRCLLIKPQTYMNNSGECLREFANFYQIPPEHILVLFDDISLDPGRLRIRRKGSDGGHNGLKSIIYQLRSDAFPRIKLGVGAKPHPDYNLADWVLGKFPEKERPAVGEAVDRACEAAELIVADKIDEAMNRFNS